MSTLHLVLALAIVTGVMQSTLDKAGVGRMEDAVATNASNALVMLSIPITFISNLGLIAIVVWSFFVLPWLPTLGVVAVAFAVFSFIWSMFLATLRRGESWPSLVAAGLPLVFCLRLLCAISVAFLAFSYVQGAP